ncbi:hypothetical protein GCM10011362_18570 [Marinobacter halophilus]|nr:hypothetical protein GCM10011362_18570 [Marinobacter halophilus]
MGFGKAESQAIGGVILGYNNRSACFIAIWAEVKVEVVHNNSAAAHIPVAALSNPFPYQTDLTINRGDDCAWIGRVDEFALIKDQKGDFSEERCGTGTVRVCPQFCFISRNIF